jgi:hypothetical protein
MSADTGAKKKAPRIWHEKHQDVLKNWGESAACYRYMHFKAYERYKRTNMLYTLPIIIIGTVTGTANFAQSTFPRDIQPYAPSVIGALNLFSAILTTVAQFLKVAELMESHRVSYINYGKLARHIKLEINLPVSERTHHGGNMLDICGAEYDRLIEQCPPVPKEIMNQFVKDFPEGDDDKKNLKFTRPEVFTVQPFDEYPFELNTPVAKEPPKRTFFSPVLRRLEASASTTTNARGELIRELDELNRRSIVSNQHVVVDIPTRAAHDENIQEGSDVSDPP